MVKPERHFDYVLSGHIYNYFKIKGNIARKQSSVFQKRRYTASFVSRVVFAGKDFSPPNLNQRDNNPGVRNLDILTEIPN